VHGIYCEPSLPNATGGFHKVDEGGDVTAAMEADYYPELALFVLPLDAAMLVWRSEPGRLVYGHYEWRGDEGREQGHKHHNGKCLIIQYLKTRKIK